MASGVPKGLVSDFLEKYKSLELMLRVSMGSDMTVLKYEDTLTGDAGDKMRICRVVRNFLQHNPNASGFIQPTQVMVTFIEKEILRVAAQAEKAKDLVYKIPVIKESMTLREAVKVFVKAKGQYAWLPVVDSKGLVLGVVTESRLLQAVSVAADLDKGTIEYLIPKSDLVKSSAGVPRVEVTDSLDKYAKASQDVIVVRNGKYSGVIQW